MISGELVSAISPIKGDSPAGHAVLAGCLDNDTFVFVCLFEMLYHFSLLTGLAIIDSLQS
ncbi:uncharacterized protein Nmag_2760 [Natrialba magadii ATCC 43099]|uniref:Uncharacterized protein n=1 Tax=Natrialba magadii (strain ATCC 43099 / DSM 3394 / CCM 3739 / CIP 104546 / IAM 13178 / JCM 8861 / NBRC 102185 / NCIMB 2190 / MS3) TaxID=547559 RepID=D3SZQ6_NATMM|nr:uncharacterized protein Nmag_2760 [Natrialba magadii ATCC 43099]